MQPTRVFQAKSAFVFGFSALNSFQARLLQHGAILSGGGAKSMLSNGAPDYGVLEASLAGNLAGFSLGIVLSILLLILTLRAVRLPGTPLANIGLAVCAILWNVGGAISSLQRPMTLHNSSVAMAVQFTGAALWPLPLLAIWRHMAVEKWQCSVWGLHS